MIIVKLQGGLGNQMFQYALAKSIEDYTGRKVELDISFKQVSTETPRKYALGAFMAVDSILAVNLKHLPVIFRNPPGDILKRGFKILRNKGWFKSNWECIAEKNFEFSIFKNNEDKNYYLDGFWQSEKYFRNIRAQLLSDFSLKSVTSQFKEKTWEMDAFESVCIHVRHGDYLSDKTTNAFHGVCSPEYHLKAINFLKNRIKTPRFYVFTDDIPWANEFFSERGLSFELISGQRFSDQEELLLMSKCRHQIIANSSFSWWGAWLNNYEEKIVIAPKIWFKSAEVDKELIPKNWIIL